MIKVIMTLCTFFLLASCSYLPTSTKFQNRNNAYLNAQSTAPLHIPPGVSSNAFHNYYPVSDKSYLDQAKVVDLQPPGLNSH